MEKSSNIWVNKCNLRWYILVYLWWGEQPKGLDSNVSSKQLSGWSNDGLYFLLWTLRIFRVFWKHIMELRGSSLFCYRYLNRHHTHSIVFTWRWIWEGWLSGCLGFSYNSRYLDSVQTLVQVEGMYLHFDVLLRNNSKN